MPVRQLQSSFLVQSVAPAVFAESKLLTTITKSMCVVWGFFKALLCSSVSPALGESKLASYIELPLLS